MDSDHYQLDGSNEKEIILEDQKATSETTTTTTEGVIDNSFAWPQIFVQNVPKVYLR